MRSFVLLSWLLAVSATTAFAQSTPVAAGYPTKPIRIIVPFSAGSASDFLARQLATKMTDNWGQQVIIDNRPSAAGIVAGEILARANPDGYTLMVTSSAIAGSAALYPKLPYDTVKDFASVSMIAAGANVFVVSPTSPTIKTLKDVAALSKKKAGQVTFGHSGIGSGTHYASELFNVVAGIKTVHVPYKGAPEVLTDAIAGRIDYGVVPIAPAVSLVKAGRVNAIAVTSGSRSPLLPDVPTIPEAGWPAFRYEGWFGMFAPGRIPPAMLKLLSAEVARILALPDVRERIMNVAMMPTPSSPETLHELLRTEIESRRKIFKDLGTQPQ
jgi:tripartite-type tricarboxylate transporter receptor subunit TctC